MEKNDIYRHKKTGNLYMVIAEAIHCTNGENENKRDVVYTYGKLIFTRLKSEFLEKFERID